MTIHVFGEFVLSCASFSI